MRIYIYLLLIFCGLSMTAKADNCYEICLEKQGEVFNWCLDGIGHPPNLLQRGKTNSTKHDVFHLQQQQIPTLKAIEGNFIQQKIFHKAFGQTPPLKGAGGMSHLASNIPNYVQGELLLKLKPNTSLSQLKEKIPFKKYGIQSIQPVFKKLPSLQFHYRLRFSNYVFVRNLLQELKETQLMEYVEQIPIHHAFYTPNDLHSSQWNLSKIEAEAAWDFVQGSEEVVVAIVDDAVELAHEDLAANIWRNEAEIPNNGIDDDENGYVDDIEGYDVADGDNNPNPPSNADAHHFSHGTHCAGIVSARTDNNKGIAAIGGNVKLMAVKTKESATVGSSLQAGMEGVEYAIAAGADVISMSWGGVAYSQTLQDLMTIAHERGIVLVAAAGNSSTSAPMYPASYEHVISVGATNQEDEKAFFSNYGDRIDVMAPGFEIWSTVAGNGYDFKNGTSMACPLVAGLAALMLSYDAHISPDDIEDCLKSTCENIDAQNDGYIGEIGAGRIHAFEALKCLRVPPTAYFEANLEVACAGEAVQFFDKSLGADIDTWNWTFENASPSFSNLQNPIVSFNDNGVFEVRLTVTNPLGSHTTSKTITIQPPTATISGNSTIAEGSNTAFKITFTGSPPFSTTYTDGEAETTVDDIEENPHYVVFSPEKTATYTLVGMSSAACEGTVEGEAKVTVLPPAQYEEATGSGLPVWPFVSNVENTCETWTWFPEENWQEFDCPFNSLFTASGIGLTPCGEPLFYVYHTGEETPNQLFVADANGQPLHEEGMNALEINRELQVVPVPDAFNEWYVIYSIFTDEILAGGRAAYTPTQIVYSRFFYDGNSFSFSEKDVVLEAGSQVRTYTHGKAVSQRMGSNEDFHYLYACRRKWNNNTLSFDRFIIDNQNIRWDKGTNSIQEDFWNLTIAGSPIEISPKGDKMVVVVRNQSYTTNDLLIVDLEQFNVSSLRKIPLGKLTLMPDFENLFEPMRIEDAVNTLPNLAFLRNMQRKVSDAEFSSSGDFLYFSGGGFVSSNYTNLTYLGQIDLTTPYPYQMRLQIQTTPDDDYDINTGRGCVYTTACLQKFNPFNAIELGYDGRLYFQKRTTNQLYALPDTNLPMPHSLTPHDVDLSSPESPNIVVDGAISIFPESIDGYQYIPPNFAKFNIPIQIEDCNACLDPENFPVTVELQTAEGTLVKAELIDECPDVMEVCLDISQQYRLFYNGMYIEDILEDGKLWTELPYIFRQNVEVDLVLETVAPMCLGAGEIELKATPIGGEFSGTGVENGIFYPSKAGLGTHTVYYEYTDASTECVALESIKIEVVGIEIEGGEPSTICPLQSVQLQASNAPNYLWTPSTGLDETDISNPIARPEQTTTYQVQTTDDNGCTAMDEVTVYVAPLPERNFYGLDTTLCKGDTLEIDLSEIIAPISNYAYGWTPTEGLSNPNIANPVVRLTESKLYTLELKNEIGCRTFSGVYFEVEILEATLDLGENLQAECGEEMVLNAPDGNAYQWSPSINLSCSDCQNPTAILNETTTFHLIFEDFNGCVAEDSITVEVVSAAFDLGENLQADCGEEMVLNAPEGNAYQWSPSINLSCSDCQNPTVILNETTTFYLTFEDFNGCVAEDSITVEVLSASFDLGENLQAECGEELVLNAPNGNAYTWSPSTNLSCSDCQNPTAILKETTTFHLIFEDFNGCVAEDSITVEVLSAAFDLGENLQVECGEEMVLNAPEGNAYQWFPSTNLSCSDCQNPTAILNETTTFHLVFEDFNGCVVEDSITVEVLSAAFDLGENLQIECGGSVELNAPEGNTYQWSPSTKLTCSDCQNPTVEALKESKTYHLIFEDLNGCVMEDSIHIEVLEPVLDLGEDLQMACGETVELSSPEGTSYHWFSLPQGILSCQNCQNPTLVVNEYTRIHLILETLNHCLVKDSIRIEVIDEIETISEELAFCEVEEVVLEGGDFTGYEWSNGSDAASIVVQDTGVYSVTLTNVEGCKSVKEFEVREYEQPQVTIEGQAEILEGATSILTALPDFDLYEWSDASTNQTIAASTAGVYAVTVTDENGCTAVDVFVLSVTLPSDSLPVDTLPTDTIPDPPIVEDLENKLIVPTAFSPNEDGVNDLFLIQGQNVAEVRYSIYNRWGQKVFEANDLVKTWNGRFRGQDLDLGMYVVDVWVRFEDGKEEVSRGWVVLVR